jgi:hypothetical protein
LHDYLSSSLQIRLAPDDAWVLGLAGFQTYFLGDDLDGGLELIQRARALNPNLAILWGGNGFLEICLGNLEVGLKQIERAMRLSPLDPSMSLWEHGDSDGSFLSGRDSEAILWATKTLRDSDKKIQTHWLSLQPVTRFWATARKLRRQ